MPWKVRAALLAAPKLKLKEADVHCASDAQIKVYGGRAYRDDYVLFELQQLKAQLSSVIVCGFKDVGRAIITLKEDGEKTPAERAHGGKCYQLLVEGYARRAFRDLP